MTKTKVFEKWLAILVLVFIVIHSIYELYLGFATGVIKSAGLGSSFIKWYSEMFPFPFSFFNKFFFALSVIMYLVYIIGSIIGIVCILNWEKITRPRKEEDAKPERRKSGKPGGKSWLEHSISRGVEHGETKDDN